ncbi:MAG: PAS domain S-box protein [Deltaproteobacteria bacterium]|nr:PAS domain S-box protein [Deltaproteobacteria bacterium]
MDRRLPTPGPAGTPSLAEVVLGLPDAVLVLCDGGRTLEYVSPTLDRVAGIPALRLLELWPTAWIEQLVHPDDRTAVRAFVAGAAEVQAGRTRDLEFRVTAAGPAAEGPGPAWRWLKARLWLYGTTARGDPRAICLWRDVTEEKLALAAALETERRYAALFDALPQAAIVFDRDDGRILDANETALRRYEYSREEIRERTISDLEVASPTADERIPTVVFGAADPRLQQRHRTRTGREIPVDVHLGPTRFGGRPATLAIVVDVSDRARAEAEFRTLHEVLVQKNREAEAALEQLRQVQELLVRTRQLDAVGQLAGGIAHKFNNFLTVVIGTLDVMSLELDAQSALHREITTAQNAALRAAELARGLAEFGASEPAQRELVDLGGVLAQLGDEVRQSTVANMEVHVQAADGLPAVEGDPERLAAALLALATNALEAMPKGGQLFLEADRLTLDETYVAARPEARVGPHVRVVVRDTGVGMDRETLGRLFEPFFTTKPAGSGGGLGLASVYATVRAHGGHVTVRSEPGRGSTFTVFLPAKSGPSTGPKRAVTPRRPTAPAARGDGQLVLVVDDDAEVLRQVERMVTSLGYRVVVADSGPAALDLLERHSERIALALVDIVMPGMGGVVTLRRLREIRPHLPAVMMTGHAARGFLPPTDLGAAVLAKPLETERLGEAIADALQRREA